jgi:putative hydrolase of the HAD superfamily
LRLASTYPYADRVARREACLVDVYETLLSCDFAAHRRDLPALAGVTEDAWDTEYSQVGSALTNGRLSKAEGFERILSACGVEPRPDLVRALVDKDRDLLLASARPYDDAIPFLEALGSRGIKIAIVSNCSEHTRDLLDKLGVTELADTLVLSYEVGASKPSATIFGCALDRLGVTAESALFVDDQPSFCAAGAALGITAVQIVRGGLDGKVPAEGTTVVRSLPEVEAMLGA